MSRLFDPTGEGYSYDFNPYSNPGRCGLEIMAVLDVPDLCYEFDTLVIWIDTATNDLYAARDSGCSCPTPFEDYRGTGDLTPVRSWDDVEGLIGNQSPNYHFDSADRFAARRKVESYLGGMKLANMAVEEFREKFLACEGAATPREEELMDTVASLETDLANARQLLDGYLTVIREQGDRLQALRNIVTAPWEL
jgi:hypothetical protein